MECAQVAYKQKQLLQPHSCRKHEMIPFCLRNDSNIECMPTDIHYTIQLQNKIMSSTIDIIPMVQPTIIIAILLLGEGCYDKNRSLELTNFENLVIIMGAYLTCPRIPGGCTPSAAADPPLSSALCSSLSSCLCCAPREGGGRGERGRDHSPFVSRKTIHSLL